MWRESVHINYISKETRILTNNRKIIGDNKTHNISSNNRHNQGRRIKVTNVGSTQWRRRIVP